MAIGVSFVPSQQNQTGSGTGAKPSGVSPVQQAVQFLSLRLPSVMGAGALAPSATMNATGAAGLGGNGSPDALLRSLLQSGGQTVTNAPAAAPTAPTPATAAPNLQAVMAGTPGSADAMIRAIESLSPRPTPTPRPPTPQAQTPRSPTPWVRPPLTHVVAGYETGTPTAPTLPRPVTATPTPQMPTPTIPTQSQTPQVPSNPTAPVTLPTPPPQAPPSAPFAPTGTGGQSGAFPFDLGSLLSRVGGRGRSLA